MKEEWERGFRTHTYPPPAAQNDFQQSSKVGLAVGVAQIVSILARVGLQSSCNFLIADLGSLDETRE
ncbi:MAG: hypothetical protein Q9159_002921 [Coniocarpon cinnabarinum]